MTHLSGCIEVAETAEAAEDLRLSANARGTGRESSDVRGTSFAGSAPSGRMLWHVSQDTASCETP